MNDRNTGFSDVDASGRSAALVDYLALLARRVADFRREGYELLRLQPGEAVLDVGCGAGEVCVELAGRVGPQGRVAGVDLSEAMIEAARRNVAASERHVELRVASAYELPFADASFDVVRAERVFQHLGDPEAGLREMLRVTRPGGRVMVLDPDHGQTGLALDEPAERKVFEAARRSLIRLIANAHSGTRLRAMFVRAGLRQVQQVARVLDVAYEDYLQAFFVHDLLASAVECGEVTAEEGRGFLASLEQRERAGSFYANAVAYSVLGVKG